MAFIFPYIAAKETWPYPPDVQYFDQFPVRQPSLLFAGLAYAQNAYLDLWRKLNPDPQVIEVLRNYPIPPARPLELGRVIYESTGGCADTSEKGFSRGHAP
jgi:hypothetical protein